MKLWKSKKSTSCVPGKFASSSSTSSKNEDKLTSISSSTTISGDRAMSPAQSEDSGLAADRGTTYATISLPRDNASTMGIVLSERTDLSYPPIIASINAYGSASDFLAPGDRIHQIDGISTVGLTNNHVLSILHQNDGPAVVEIEYCLPEYISQNSLCVTSKLAQITVERENGCFGLTLRGGGESPLIVTNVRPHGPAFKTGRIKPGDRVLRVDNVSLINKTLLEAQQILKCGNASGYTNLTIEYDVSVMQSVEFSMGPLLIEIERPMNDKLGLVLSNFSNFQHGEHFDDVTPAGVYVSSILAASIADRCGALSSGDQILSIDETVIENTALSPDDVMGILDANTNKGYTQIQIMPSHALARRGMNCSTFNTIESRKNTKQRKYTRKSSLPLDSGTLHANLGICRSESIQVVLDCSQGSGIIIGSKTACGRGYVITQILPDSVADRSGCIQKNDRIISINKLYNLDATVIRQILGDLGPRNVGGTYQGTHWVELEVEFDMADSVIPASGVFNVKLIKFNSSGLGLTVNATNHGSYVITEVKPGSPAHRTGSLRPGDILLAVDAHTLQHFNVDSLLKENKSDYTTLTIKRTSLPDFLFDAQQRCNTIYSNTGGGSTGTNDDCVYGYKTRTAEGVSFKAHSNGGGNGGNQQPEYFQLEDSRQTTPVTLRPFLNKKDATLGRTLGNENTQSLTTEVNDDDQYNDIGTYESEYHQRFKSFDSTLPPPMEPQHVYGTHQIVSTVRLEANGGPLGITLAGSEDQQKPIIISGLIDGGCAYNTQKLQIGDCLLAINGQSVQEMPLSHATKILQTCGSSVELKISRNFNGNESEATDCMDSMPQPQAVYAKVQRRPRSPSYNADIVMPNATTLKDAKYRSFHVTLYKDNVYDDFGFSVSDGLYERGVYINRIRSGGPADIVGLLKPFDRIMQVNGIKTHDFDCCLTVPLIASAGDKINLIIKRLAE